MVEGMSFSAKQVKRKSQSVFFRNMGSQSYDCPIIQPKLTVNMPGDVHEREADTVADRVMRMVAPSDSLVRRTCIDCENEEKGLQRKQDEGQSPIKRQVYPFEAITASIQREADDALPQEDRSYVKGLKTGGKPMDERERSFFEPRFGRDFSAVRLHTDVRAARSASNLNAHAYTYGNDIVFGANRYAPNTAAGKKLMAHELTHVVQQRSRQSGNVQRFTEFSTAEQTANASLEWKSAGTNNIRVSDDGNMVSDGTPVTDRVFVEAALIKKANAIFQKNNSMVRFEEDGASMSGKAPNNPKGGKRNLKKVKATDDVGNPLNLADDCGTACLQSMKGRAASEKMVGVNQRGTTEEYTSVVSYHADDVAPGGTLSTGEEMTAEIYIRIIEREFNKRLNRKDALTEWDALSHVDKERLSKKYGINQFALPEIGQGMSIVTEFDMPGFDYLGRNAWNFHFGTAAFLSGTDYINIEDFAGSGQDYMFQMYGPTSKGQSFHDQQGPEGHGNKFTTLLIRHPSDLKGQIRGANSVVFCDDPANPGGTTIGALSKGDQVEIIRKGHSWMKVKAKTGSMTGKEGWILSKFFGN